jgi:hypothetical protein
MENNEKQNNIAERIIDKIKEGEIKMKPKAYFIARMVLFVLGITVLSLFLIYIVSFIIFSSRISGGWFLPQFGFSGIGILLRSLPWLLISLSIILIIFLEIFAEHFSFIYKKATVYSLFGIIGIVLLAGFMVGLSPFHTSLFQSARNGELPLIGSFYERQGAPRFNNFHNVSVSSVGDKEFTVINPRGEILRVITEDQIDQELKEGDSILLIGQRDGDIIKFKQMRKVNEDANFFPKHRPGKMMRPPFLK